MDALDEGGGDEGGGSEWMATFADLSTLLLTFFVLLLSFSNMDVVAFRDMLGSVKDAFGVQRQIHGRIEAIASSPVELSITQTDGSGMAGVRQQVEPGHELYRQISEFTRSAGMQDDVEVEWTPRGVVLRVKEHALYASASADIESDEAKAILHQVAAMHATFDVAMQIEGHTDNVPISTRRYQSNWELSTARAIAALRWLEQHEGVPASSMGVAGYADSRPIADNDTPAGRERNRRVDFLFRREPATGEDAAQARAEPTMAEPPVTGPERPAFLIPMSGIASRRQ